MVIDAAKGVEERTVKLMDVCRLRATPIFTFVNKLDREGREPLDLLDEVERVLRIRCAPVTWPIGMGSSLHGIYHIANDAVHLYAPRVDHRWSEGGVLHGIDNPILDEVLGPLAGELREQMELVRGASHAFDPVAYRAGELTPVFFGSALNNFGVDELMDTFVEHAPGPQPYATESRQVRPEEEPFSGFVFKIQANMDPAHRDRVAFVRVCSGVYRKGMRVFHVRLGRELRVSDALTFLAADRGHTEEAYPGDIIGLHSHGTIRLGDAFSEGEPLKFTGIPSFAPEIFRRVRLRDPLKAKALQKGLDQLCEEGATQVFRPLLGNDVVLGAVGMLQFDVVAYRLQDEYRVDCAFEPVGVATARWADCDQRQTLEEFRNRNAPHLALDHAGELVYLAPTQVNLQLTRERWPDIRFRATREQ
jgi:peptide chain release factor 3